MKPVSHSNLKPFQTFVRRWRLSFSIAELRWGQQLKRLYTGILQTRRWTEIRTEPNTYGCMGKPFAPVNDSLKRNLYRCVAVVHSTSMHNGLLWEIYLYSQRAEELPVLYKIRELIFVARWRLYEVHSFICRVIGNRWVGLSVQHDSRSHSAALQLLITTLL